MGDRILHECACAGLRTTGPCKAIAAILGDSAARSVARAIKAGAVARGTRLSPAIIRRPRRVSRQNRIPKRRAVDGRSARDRETKSVRHHPVGRDTGSAAEITAAEVGPPQVPVARLSRNAPDRPGPEPCGHRRE